jgi:hypothetical protein
MKIAPDEIRALARAWSDGNPNLKALAESGRAEAPLHEYRAELSNCVCPGLTAALEYELDDLHDWLRLNAPVGDSA